jgi:hypothetical protein
MVGVSERRAISQNKKWNRVCARLLTMTPRRAWRGRYGSWKGNSDEGGWLALCFLHQPSSNTSRAEDRSP